MQISTRSQDFIIDAMKLRSHLGSALCRPFADPSVLKIMHGSDSDILWLQKDFGLWVVNMFDTGQAARLLGMKCGLGSLLEEVVSVQVRTACLLGCMYVARAVRMGERQSCRICSDCMANWAPAEICLAHNLRVSNVSV